MRIAAEIAQDVLGSAEWPLAVNNPLLSVRLPNQFGKHLWPSEWLQVAVKAQSVVPLRAAGISGAMESTCDGQAPDLRPERCNGHADDVRVFDSSYGAH
jgi:hypothetical protein